MRSLPALASVGLLSLLILWPWRLGARAAAEPPTVAGPFEIAARPKEISAGGFPNTSYAEAGPTGGSEAAHALVEKIGAGFNAELTRGEHQSRFGAYDDSR